MSDAAPANLWSLIEFKDELASSLLHAAVENSKIIISKAGIPSPMTNLAGLLTREKRHFRTAKRKKISNDLCLRSPSQRSGSPWHDGKHTQGLEMKNVSRVPWFQNLTIIQGAFVLIITRHYKQIFRLHMMSGLRHSFEKFVSYFCFEKRRRSDFDASPRPTKTSFYSSCFRNGEICAPVGEYGAGTWQIDVKQQIYFFLARKNLTNFLIVL